MVPARTPHNPTVAEPQDGRQADSHRHHDRPNWYRVVEPGIRAVEARLHQALVDPRLGDPIGKVALHLIEAGGKRIRPALVLLAAGACRDDLDDVAVPIACAAELIHSASLLHDDVLDEGDRRRGRPTSRIVWNNSFSVLSGDYCLALALSEVASTGHIEAVLSLNRTVTSMVNAEAIQIRSRDELDLSRAAYFEVIQGKTASLMAWCSSLGGLPADPETRILETFGLELGTAFQVTDDLLDYFADPDELGKNLGKDLSEGKVTLPLIEAIEEKPELRDAVAHLTELPEQDALIEARSVMQAVTRTGAIDRTRQVAIGHADKAAASLADLPASTFRDALVDLAHFAAQRAY